MQALPIGIQTFKQIREEGYIYVDKADVDLPNEFTSMVGFGEFLTTPIQMSKYIASIATGELLNPHFIKQIDTADKSNNPKYIVTVTLDDKNNNKMLKFGYLK